ncbi:MAG: hypothetical protein ACRD1C_07165 [Terriglobales bacterium]
MRQRILLPVLAVWVCCALALAAQTADTAQSTNTIDPAYAAGYNAAYGLGVQDKGAGLGANAHKYSVYQEGLTGYTAAYGAQVDYRTRFQNGFSDGYFDGYNGRKRALLAPPPSAAPPDAQAEPPATGTGGEPAPAPAPAATLADTAKANGYREGYNTGQSDANSGAIYNSTASNEYKQALVGYTAALGDSGQYQDAFRQGFTLGYDDGYNHRLYNTVMGARSRPAAAAPSPPAQSETAANPAGAQALPLGAEASTRPSGVYDNGVLVASGTVVRAQLDNELDTKQSYVGEAFTLTTTVPVWVGAVAAIPAGSKITGIVQGVKRGGEFSGHAQLQLQYDTLILPGQAPIALNATTQGVGNAAVNSAEGTVNGQKADTGKRAGVGAGMGAVLGGIFGGYGGLARGAIAGAAVGTAGEVISRKRDLTLRVGEPISVALQNPVELPKPGAGQ